MTRDRIYSFYSSLPRTEGHRKEKLALLESTEGVSEDLGRSSIFSETRILDVHLDIWFTSQLLVCIGITGTTRDRRRPEMEVMDINRKPWLSGTYLDV
jgi:hypothetical protein